MLQWGESEAISSVLKQKKKIPQSHCLSGFGGFWHKLRTGWKTRPVGRGACNNEQNIKRFNRLLKRLIACHCLTGIIRLIVN